MRGTRLFRIPNGSGAYLSIAQSPADAAVSLAATRPFRSLPADLVLVGVRTRSRDRSVGRYKPSKKDDLVGHATHYKQLQETARLRAAR
jgi:hypothetical protein